MRLLALVLLCALAAGCGGGGGDGPDPHRSSKKTPITVWIADTEPERVQAAREGTLPDAIQLPMASAHVYARQRILNANAAQDVVRDLGEDRFSARALSLLTSEGRVTAVPSFEYVALAAGCQLVDDAGDASLDSLACVRAFALYSELARRYSPGGKQDVDTTRDAYFAGRAAMILWSPFLLDAMAGDLAAGQVPAALRAARRPGALRHRMGSPSQRRRAQSPARPLLLQGIDRLARRWRAVAAALGLQAGPRGAGRGAARGRADRRRARRRDPGRLPARAGGPPGAVAVERLSRATG